MSYQSDGYGNGYGYNYNNNRNKQKKQKPHAINQNILDQLDAMLEESTVRSTGNKSAATNNSHDFSTGSGEESGPPPKPRFVPNTGVVKKDKVQQKIDRVRPVGSAMMVNQEPSASGQVYMDKAKEKAARYDAGNMKMQTSTVNSDKVNAAPVAVVAQATVVSASASVVSGGSSGSGGSSSASGPPPLPKYVSSNDSVNSKYTSKSQAYTHKTQASAYAAYTSTVTPSVTRPVLPSVVEETKHDYHYQASESEPMQVPQSSAPPLPTMAYNTANDKFQRKIANAGVAARQYAEGDYVTANAVLGMNSADGEGTSKEKWESQNAKNSKGRRSEQYKAKNNEAYAPYEASTIAGSLPMQSNQAPIPVAVVVQPDSNSQYQSNLDDMSSMSPPYPPTYEEPVVQTQMQMKPEDEIDLTAAFLKSTKMITKVTEETSDGRKSVTTTTVHKRRDGRVIKTIEEEKELDEVGKHGTTVVQPVQVAGCCIVS